MANLAVIGASPVTFIGEDTAGSNVGIQYQVPLSALQIKPDGTFDRSNWKPKAPPSAADLKILDVLLAGLLAQGVITAAPA